MDVSSFEMVEAEDSPKACLRAVDLVRKGKADMPETLDAVILTKMAQWGWLGRLIADGPVIFDLAISSQAAELKGVKSPIAGEADIFLVPDVAVGNIFVKALIYSGEVGGIVVGQKPP